MTDFKFGIRYADFWSSDGGGVIKGLFTVPEDAATDGVISLDDLSSWTLDWTGNDAIAPFSFSSDDGTASALVDPSGFLLDGTNTAFNGGNDADGLDQGLYEAGSGDQIIDLGALLLEDFAAGTFSEGVAAEGAISVGELVDISVLYSGFWEDGAVEGTLTVIDADAEDGIITLDELIGWELEWTGNDDVEAFSISSEEGEAMALTSSANALLPDNGFLLNDDNTAVDALFNDSDGVDQGLYESGSGDEIIDLGALIIENVAAGTVALGDASEGSILVGTFVDFDVEYTGFWGEGTSVVGQITTTEQAAADGLVELDELAGWTFDWSGNDEVAAFTISSDNGTAIALGEPGGFLLDGSNTPFDPFFNDEDGVDQGIFEADDQVIDLGALIIEDLGAGTLTQSEAPGTITVNGESNEIDGPDVDPIDDPIDDPIESQGELVGFASLAADTFADGPPSGADNGRVDAVNRIQPIDANGRTGPFEGQPVQGFSAVQFAPDSDGGTYWFLSDNGFGGESNSSDYLLRLYQVAPSFNGQGGDGSVAVEGFVNLRDPNGLIPFDIQNEGSGDRLLTGSDFDLESFVLDANGDIWVGEEFGPFLLHFDSEGVLLEAPIATPNPEIITQRTGEVVPLIDVAHNAGLHVTDFPRTGDPVRDTLVSDDVRSPNNPDFDFNTLNGQTPLVIGHRGASGDLPEHTLEAYRLAIYQGADFVEPDLVITSDGVLIARHEPILDDTTNVAEVFGPERMSTKILDGQEVTAYFAEDFTLAEIKQLRAVQSRSFRNQEFNGEFEIPTFGDVLALVNELSAEVGRDIGVYPETKHPTFFDQQNLSLEEPLVQALIANDFTNPNRIFIQSFEISNLLDLRNTILPEAGLDNLKLVQLFGDTDGSFINDGGGGFSVPYDLVVNQDLTDAEKTAIYGDLLPFLDFENPGYGSLANAEAITEISTYADGLGPWKNNILLRESLDTPVDGNGDGEAEIGSQLTGEVVPLIDWAHDAGLQIHPYTLRDEERFLTLNPDGTPQTPDDEFRQLIELGVDGFFTDFPETGRIVVEQFETAEEFANLRGSRGYEGMAFSPDRQTLYPMLEGTVFGDPEASLRIYEFDVATSAFEGILGLYQMDDSSHAIGDFTPINETEFLVIERDGRQGADAAFKKIFKVDISEIDADGFVEKEEVVDLLNIADPNDLNGDGDTTFSFPFVTIENVLVLDAETILVANDNNYPFSIGRDFSGREIDNNEIIQIKLAEPLDLDERLGIEGLSIALPSDSLDFDAENLAAGTIVTDQFSGLTISSDDLGVMIFDTSNPSKADPDLASDTLGNVLILSEDGNSEVPNDSRSGGTMSFVWDSAVNIDSVGFLDVEESGQTTITLFDEDGSTLGTFAGSRITTAGGTGALDIGVSDVSRMDIRLASSGAITDVTYF